MTSLSFPGAGWQPATSEGSRFSPDGLAAVLDEARRIDTAALLLLDNGRPVLEFGDLARRYKSHSIRKSLLSALYGIHVAAGRIDLAATLADLGIDDKLGLTDVEKRATVYDLLMARSGIYHPTCHESARMRAIREPRGSHGPSTYWVYNNWDFNALGTIFDKLVGCSLFEEFRDRLATPLGMQDFRYDAERRDGEYSGSDETVHPAYPFRISTRDLARFGLLYLADGVWNGQRLLPETWVAQSVQPYSHAGADGAYGFMWWLERSGVHLPGVIVPPGTYSA
ncbi:MAG: serine hydrolase domain-containing protein, partial [Hyphomicrobiaceae bacterium]